jgi:hypothetical protein
MPLCRKRSRRNRDAPKLPSIRDKCPRCEYGPTGSCCISIVPRSGNSGGTLPPPISRRKYLVFFSLERAFPTKYFLQKDLLTEILRSITYGDPRAPLAEIMKKFPLKISQGHSFTERFSSSPVCRSGDCCWDTRISLCAGWVELPANAKAVADARFPPVLS